MSKLDEIDEALKYAAESKQNIDASHKHIINEFIDELLDDRNLITGVDDDNTHCYASR